MIILKSHLLKEDNILWCFQNMEIKCMVTVAKKDRKEVNGIYNTEMGNEKCMLSWVHGSRTI